LKEDKFMKKFLLISLIVLLPLLLSGCGKKETNQNTTNQNAVNQNVLSGPTLFVSSTCGHCANVKKFISENDITNKVQFAEKEVSSSQDNYDLWLEKGKSCGIPDSQMGVPLLSAQGKCYLGEVEVMDYFKEKAGIK